MSVATDPRLLAIAESHPAPLLFATISGAHLYGFPSPNSDFDLRGVHVLPLQQVIGLRRGPETIERMDAASGLDLDLVTHDVAKFVRLMRKPNGYVLEQLFSPLVVYATPWHSELRELGKRCVTRGHSRHYLGFAETQWRLFTKDSTPRVKPLLYVYRVLLTGIHLLRTGEVQADLSVLNQQARLTHVEELIHRKRTGTEKAVLANPDVAFHQREYERLGSELRAAAASSTLPCEPSPEVDAGLHDFLVNVRLAKFD